MKPTLSIVVLTHNDENRIVDCLEMLGFGDELIIVDDNSKDRTVDLAAQFTKNIYIHPLGENFSNQRNFALNKAHGDWVLFIDSDEIVTHDLAQQILSAVRSNRHNGYMLKRIDYMWGRKILHGEGGKMSLLRLAKKGQGKWHGKVHEKWIISGSVGFLDKSLKHIPHQSVFEFLKEIDAYSTLRSEELRENEVNSNCLSILLYPLGKFFINYFVKKGYKDGVAGFVYAMMMSFHSFLVRSKLFLLSKS